MANKLYTTVLYKNVIETNPDDGSKGMIIDIMPTSANNELFLDKRTGELYIKNSFGDTIHWYGPDYNQPKYYAEDIYALGTNEKYILFLTNGGDLIVTTSPLDKPWTNKTIQLDENKIRFKASWGSYFNPNEPTTKFTGKIDINDPDNKNYNYYLELVEESGGLPILYIRRKTRDTIPFISNVWQTSAMWESLRTPYSIKIADSGDYALFDKAKDYNPNVTAKKSIIYEYQSYLINKNRPLNYNPFKILPLYFFMYYKNVKYDEFIIAKQKQQTNTDTGKLSNSYKSGRSLIFQANIDVKAYDWYGNRYFFDGWPFQFIGQEGYLPMGDPYIAGAAPSWGINVQKGTLIPLIKNEEKYCKKLEKNNYKECHDNWECNYYSAYRYSNLFPNPVKSAGYSAIGGIISHNNWKQLRDNISVLNRFTDNPTNFIAVAASDTYVYEYKNTRPRDFAFFGDDNGSKCGHDHNMCATSFFSTYQITSGATKWWTDGVSKFFDFVPTGAILATCANEFNPNITDGGVSITLKSLYDATKCNQVGGLNACSLDSGNLATDACFSYYKSQNDKSDGIPYDNTYLKFCEANNNWKRPEFSKLCACFIPDSALNDYIEDIISYVPEAQKDQAKSFLTDSVPCIFPNCSREGVDVLPRFKFNKSEKCKTNDFQLCLNSATITNSGDVGDINIEGVNDCVQSSFKGEETTPPPEKKQNNLAGIIIAFFVVLILAIILIKKA